MPAIVRVLQIVNITGNGIAHLENSLFTKTYSGSGGFTTGEIAVANNGMWYDVFESNLIDQPEVGNNINVISVLKTIYK
ncbi:spore germination protein [Bacillus sp. EB600]|uniref:spore germination protein n=1 Tax=Bacillus sp. EB600 TaxID=2806345 RepID=UPI00210A192B|nr:spore germination protein [Bacillus sp. EB600]MCQ6281973.1 spore germination protein [Bacillus sp. EB600]